MKDADFWETGKSISDQPPELNISDGTRKFYLGSGWHIYKLYKFPNYRNHRDA